MTNFSPYATRARSAATLAAYDRDWRDFASWCTSQQKEALPTSPETIAEYLSHSAGRLRPASLKRRLAAIIVRHRAAGFPLDSRHPLISDTMAGIRRALGAAPRQKEPLELEDIRAMVAALPRSRAGLRDRAVILLGFAGAFRRSELAALERRDLCFTGEGVAVALRRSKENPDGGRLEIKAIPFGRDPAFCPVRALKDWMMAAALDEGPLFRATDMHGNLRSAGLSGQAIAAIVKRAVARQGRSEGWTKAEIAARVATVAGHSLRAGFVTSAAAAGASEWEIMQHTGHRRSDSVRRYIRLGSLFANPVLRKVGM